jgi:hypothetical protein
MSFYNQRSAVQRFVDNAGFIEPLDVVEYGGQFTVEASLAGAGSIGVLANPPTGFAWRLHRCIFANGGAGLALAELEGNPSAFLYSYTPNPAGGIDRLDGQLVLEGLSFTTVGAGAILYLTYDNVTIPYIA